MKDSNSNHDCDHGVMDVLKHQSSSNRKTTFCTKQMSTVLTAWGSTHLFYAKSSFFDCVMIGASIQQLNHGHKHDLSWTVSITVVIIRACECWPLFVTTLNVDNHSPWYIYIYMCVYVHTCIYTYASADTHIHIYIRICILSCHGVNCHNDKICDIPSLMCQAMLRSYHLCHL